MKKLIDGVLFIALVGMVIIGCQEENWNQTTSLTNQSNDLRGTGKVDPIEFGKLHNEYLIEAINYASKNKSVNAKLSLMSVNIPNLTKEEQSIVIDHFSNLTGEQMKDSTFRYFVNPKAGQYYNEIELVLENATDYNDLNQKLDIVVDKINQDLEDTDWDIVMVYLETIRTSAYIWFSEIRGGSGIGYKYAQTSPNHLSRDLPGWVKADGRGAGYGMVAWSFSAFLGPVGIGGFVYGAVSGAVFSSLDAL